MNMSIIEIALFVALHFYGSVIPQLTHKRLTRRYNLPFDWRLAVIINSAFCTLYLWIMSVSTWGYHLIWGFSILGIVLSTIQWAAIKRMTKSRTLEV